MAKPSQPSTTTARLFDADCSDDDPSIFWFVIVGIVVVAALTLLTLRVRKWL